MKTMTTGTSLTHPIPAGCPTCQGALRVTALSCAYCGVEIRGRFHVGRLGQLPLAHQMFIEVFVRCRGSIKEVEKELGISYPTVKNRLEQAVKALGFHDEAATRRRRAADVESARVLGALEQGEITAQEAIQLLNRPEAGEAR